jgi:hypothetical protein
VIQKLDFLVRFWELKARHATLGQPLGPKEQIELLSLMQLVTHDVRVPKAGSAVWSGASLPAQLIGDGTILSVEVRSVTAAALVVACTGSMSVGVRVIVRAADAVSGVEYALPCTVAWVHPGAPNTMALAVDGIPMRSTFSSPSDAHTGSALAMGRQEPLVG